MPGRPIALACLLLAVVTAPAPVALAQETTPSTTVVPSINPEDQLGGGLAPGTTPGATAPLATTPGAVTPDDAELPPASDTTAPAPTTAGPTPTPPPYLAPGAATQVQPVSSVASLTDPDVPLEPLRLAALAAALIAALLIGGTALLRTLGVRTATGPAVVASTGGGPASRARERLNALADDVRDFLRHSR